MKRLLCSSLLLCTPVLFPMESDPSNEILLSSRIKITVVDIKEWRQSIKNKKPTNSIPPKPLTRPYRILPTPTKEEQSTVLAIANDIRSSLKASIDDSSLLMPIDGIPSHIFSQFHQLPKKAQQPFFDTLTEEQKKLLAGILVCCEKSK